MKKIYIIIVYIFTILFIPNVNAVEKVDSSQKIYDYGDLLTSQEEMHLKELIDDYIENYKMDLVILTKKNYVGDMRSYAQDFYDYNTFGKNSTKDGILLFLNVDSKGPIVEIVTTGEAILIYDDERIDGLMTSMKSAKANGNSAIVEIFIRRASKYAEKGVPESNSDKYIDEKREVRVYKTDYTPLGFIIIPFISASITILIVYLLARKNKTVAEAVDASTYLDPSSFYLIRNDTNLVSTHTTRLDISVSNSSSGGGSSISHGSSGISHGGGGGRL